MHNLESMYCIMTQKIQRTFLLQNNQILDKTAFYALLRSQEKGKIPRAPPTGGKYLFAKPGVESASSKQQANQNHEASLKVCQY